MESLLLHKFNYWVFIILMMIGLWAMVSKKNLIKKVMGMSIFQTAIIMFYVSIAAKESGANIPIYPHDLIHPPHAEQASHAVTEAEGSHHAQEISTNEHGETNHELVVEKVESHGHVKISNQVDPDLYDNPLPHVLMLTAIVVGVATLGVALSLIQRIYRLYGSIEEDEILLAIRNEKENDLGLEPVSNQTKESGSHA